MKFKRYFDQSIINLFSAKLRSFLAILGIVIGTCSIVALISSGQLATDKALAQFKSLGTHLLSIAVYQTKQQSNGNNISLETWRKLPEDVPNIKNVAPYSSAYQYLSYESRKVDGILLGGDPELADITDIKLASGIFVPKLATFEHICVIGNNIKKQLQRINFVDPLGKQIRVGNTLYTIIGITEPWQENGFFTEDINQAIIIPIAGMAMVNQSSKVNNALVSLVSDEDLDSTMQQIKTWLGQKAPNLGVFMRSAKQIINSMEQQGKIFTLLMAVIGGISMLVGGIGVMNIMLVAVAERKKEIGLRKAVGATNKEIQKLFLTESLILSLAGGSIGIVLGFLVTYIIAHFNNWPFNIHLIAPITGFAISVLTGIFFGFYPAKRAAALEPIACLRSQI